MPFSRLARVASVLVCLLLLVSPSRAQTPLGDYTDHTVTDTSVTVWADTSGLRLVWYRPEVLRVDLLPSPSTTRDSSLVIVREPSAQTNFSVSGTAEALTVSTNRLTARIQKNPVRLHVMGKNGSTLLEEPDEAGYVAEGDRRRAQFTLPSDARFYGTGERGLDINLRGERVRVDNVQNFGYNGVVSPMNINVPLTLTSQGYGLLFDNPYPGTFDFGARDPSRFSYEAEGGELSYFVLAGEDLPAQLKQYTWLTGRPPMPPKWALGYIQSKYGYRTAEAARTAVNELRANDIPADGLVLDLYWFERMGDLSWDESAFPNPSQMISDFEDKGIKTFVITEPYITDGSDWFTESVQDGAPEVGRRDDGSAYRLGGWWSCGCDAVLTDFTHAPTRDWWKTRYTEILNSGVHGLWTDLGEPEAHPSDMQHAGGPAPAVHNVYNLLWAKTVHDVFTDQRPNRRLVNLTRSGYAGIQRYGVFTWSADVSRSFTGLSVQRPILLNTTLSGLYYHSSDIGGFVGQVSPELYTRWMQMGVFTPVARAHGIDNQPTEPWRIGSPAPSISRRYIELRYRLLPYLYTMAYRAHDRGMPIVRPLFFENPDAPRLAEEDDAYLFGDSFLAAPVVEKGKRTKDVPLPPGTWINYWTDEGVQGGQTVTVDAPLDRLPLFVKKGAIVPMRPTAPDYVGHSVADTLELAVYPSAGESRFTLYEDDGYTRAYRQGAFAMTPFTQQNTSTDTSTTVRLRLGPTRGSFDGKPERRTYHAIVHRVGTAPHTVTLDGTDLPERSSPSALRTFKEGYAYDESARHLHIRARVGVDAEHTLRAHIPAGEIPIELTRFDARLLDDGVRLAWTTVGETSGNDFQVQRWSNPPASLSNETRASRGDAGRWSTIGRVDAGAASTYRFTDETLPFAADSMAYRLKQIDESGSASYSTPITVRRTVQSVQLYPPTPNPARGQVTVRLALPNAQAATLRLYDVLGRQVEERRLGRQAGRRTVQLDVSGLSSGTYFLRLHTDETVATKRVTVVQ